MDKFCACVCSAAIILLILVVVCDITRQRCGKCDKCKGVNKMERLTRPTVEVDDTAAKYMGSFPVDIRTYKDRLLELILNGPTLNGVSKDALRQIIRQLYGRLKEYEDSCAPDVYTEEDVRAAYTDGYSTGMAQGVEKAVVRCKGCKHCDPENGHCDHPMGTTLSVARKPDDFCSYGERKDGEG